MIEMILCLAVAAAWPTAAETYWERYRRCAGIESVDDAYEKGYLAGLKAINSTTVKGYAPTRVHTLILGTDQWNAEIVLDGSITIDASDGEFDTALVLDFAENLQARLDRAAEAWEQCALTEEGGVGTGEKAK